MPPTYLLGIDLGTTTCRAAVFDSDGHEVASASVEMPVRYPQPLWAEVDPEDWWRGVVRVVRETLRVGVVAPDRIAGIGLSGLMHAPVLLDGAGKPVVPAMLWMDQRCAPQCDGIRRDAEIAGVRPARELGTSVTAPKLRWLAEEQPGALARARALLLPKDYIRFRLSGTAGTDPGDAGGTGLFDRQQGEWAWDLVDLCRVPRALLPAVRPPAARAGVVTPEAAAATGLAPGTPVATGSSDTFCTRLGAGRLSPGEACIYLGTAAWISIAADAPATRPGGSNTGAATGAASDTGATAVRGFGATSTTGAALRWLRDLLEDEQPRRRDGSFVELSPSAAERPPSAVGPAGGVAASYEALTRPAEQVPPGAEGLLFLPHLMGERGPVADPLARGALVGLTLRHGRAHVVRAVIEGTAFQIRRLIDARSRGAPPPAAVACGGAARGALWMQILADVTRVPLRVPAVVETAVLGAAILGGAAAGLLTIDAAQERMVRPGATYEPDPQRASWYDAVYARYCRLDDLLAPWFREAVA